MVKPHRLPHWHSLSSKLLILSMGWLVIAMTSIGLTLILSWKLEGGAAAINDAGSLRMRTYRTALLLDQGASDARIAEELRGFSATLARLRRGDPVRPLFLPDDAKLRAQAALIAQSWQRDIVPTFDHSLSHRQAQLTVLPGFVDRIDHLVKLIEQDNARNITLLRLFQMSLIVIATLGAMLMMYLLFVLVIRPLDLLGHTIQRLRDGDLDSRVTLLHHDEFGAIAAAFNQMAQRLQDLYTTLEQKVRDKTRAVEEKNHQLSTLYQVTAFLHDSHDLETTCQGFIERLMGQVNGDAASVRLIDSARGKLDQVVQVGLPDELVRQAACASIQACFCGDAIAEPAAVMQHFRPEAARLKPCQAVGFASIAVFHIRHNHHDVGIFTLYFRERRELSLAEQLLVEALGKHLGVAIANLRLEASARQLAVSEERSLMAQGLHDSIAQSLSFLNLQVQMLQQALPADVSPEAQENLAFIHAGVQECYEDVRELLQNFRTRLLKEDFPQAVRSLLDRFEQQCRVPTELTVGGNGLPLNPKQQLQVLFILQEALSNVRKHAGATRVSLSIENHEDFVMTIRDNGAGFDPNNPQHTGQRHIGLSIMKERAEGIHSQITIQSAPGAGTTLELALAKEERLAL